MTASFSTRESDSLSDKRSMISQVLFVISLKGFSIFVLVNIYE